MDDIPLTDNTFLPTDIPLQMPTAPVAAPVVPAQIEDLLGGIEPALQLPAQKDGYAPTTAEEYAKANFDSLMAQGLRGFNGQDGSVTIYHPERFAEMILHRMDAEGRLPEVVNGTGNATIPKNATSVVQVSNRGERIREVLVKSSQDIAHATRAASVNPNNQVLLRDIPMQPGTDGKPTPIIEPKPALEPAQALNPPKTLADIPLF